MRPPSLPKSRRPRRLPPVEPTSLETVLARLQALAPERELPVLWSRAELSRQLTAAERPQLAAALGRLQEDRQVLALSQGKGTYYLFAGPLRGWLAGSAVVSTPLATDQKTLDDVYRRLVRESGGFPDVKISALRTALGPGAGGSLADELLARWRRGEATLSLGDWSLASEETRAAAVEMDGEKYLLVRFEEAE